MISVIIPTITNRAALFNRLYSDFQSLKPEVQEIIVENIDSEFLAEKRNYGATRAKGKYLFFIDDDNLFEKNIIQELLVTFIKNKDAGIVGCVAYYDDKRGVVCDSGSMRNLITGFTGDKYVNGYALSMPHNAYEVDEVANAFMVKREVLEDVGGFDAKTFPIDLHEADFCRRVKKAGYKILMQPRAIVYHRSLTYSRIPDFRSAKNAYFMARGRILFQRKHRLPLCFLPVFIASYIFCILCRGRVFLLWHFMMGVVDGVFYRLKRAERYRLRRNARR